MRTLVTGATGLVGNNVVRLLLEQGQAVRVLMRSTSDRRPLADLDIEVVHGDLREPDAIRRACQGVEGVIHSAAFIQIGWTGLEISRAINVEGSRAVALAAREAGAKLVHVSTVDTLSPGSPDSSANEDSVGEKTPCAYVVSKREAEQAVLDEVDRGLDAVIVHPGFMLGPWDWKPSSGRMLIEVARRFTPAAPVGGMSVCDVRDVAAGILAALENGASGRRYILAGYNMTYFDCWKLFAEVAGGRGPLFRMGPLFRNLCGWSGDLAAKLTGNEGSVNSAAIKMSSLFHYYNSGRAQSELGYQSRHPEESVHEAWRWFSDYGYV